MLAASNHHYLVENRNELEMISLTFISVKIVLAACHVALGV